MNIEHKMLLLPGAHHDAVDLAVVSYTNENCAAGFFVEKSTRSFRYVLPGFRMMDFVVTEGTMPFKFNYLEPMSITNFSINYAEL